MIHLQGNTLLYPRGNAKLAKRIPVVTGNPTPTVEPVINYFTGLTRLI
jgi:hypothetical protein